MLKRLRGAAGQQRDVDDDGAMAQFKGGPRHMQSLELQNLNSDEIGTQGMPVDEPEEPYGDDDDDDEKKNKTKPVGLLGYNKCSSFREDYHEKFKEAMYPPGCSEGVWENFCYIVLFPWNCVNMLIPPTTLLYGWGTFVVSLACTGFVTAMISDLANLFGCVIGLSGEITAITFVALGTSVPDTFASRIAIQQDDNADSAITNVTGSNSVNVFLGLGLSWGISAIYWATQDVPSARWTRTLNVYEFKSGDDIRGQYADKFGAGKPFFFVDAGNLGFSVGVFSGCSLLAFAILHYQKTQGGELGGPNRNKMAAAFVSIWLIFLIMSGLNSEGHFGSKD